jgi:hypothetical protein
MIQLSQIKRNKETKDKPRRKDILTKRRIEVEHPELA